jgi:hypothetical protein
MVRIGDRPGEVLDRRNPGHWEGDLLVGRYGRSQLVTLVERHSRYLMVLPLPDATSASVVAAVTAALGQLPEPMRKTLTWDRGVEMTRHAEFTTATGVPVYFCDAYCPWQRGSNENTNGLLRQYFPKKTVLPVRQRSRAGSSRRRDQQTTPTSTGMEHSTRGRLGHRYCDDCLKPQSPTVQVSTAVDTASIRTAPNEQHGRCRPFRC